MLKPDGRKYQYVITPKRGVMASDILGSTMRSTTRMLNRSVHLTLLELKQQIFGLSFGRLWHVIEPLLQALTYYFLITVIFGMSGSDSTFAWFLVAIIYWRSHATLVVSAPSFLTSKGYNYIDQGFGLKLAFMESLIQEFILFLIRFSALVVFIAVSQGHFGRSTFYGLLIAICMFSFSAALSMWLAVAGMYFRDLGRFSAHAVWLWWYLSPGLYSMQKVPGWAVPFYTYNPFSYILPSAHAALLGNGISTIQALPLAIIFAASLAMGLVGWKVMKRAGYLTARYV